MVFLRERSVYCIPNSTLDSDKRLAISVICISTSTVGFVGAALQLRDLWQYRNRQRRRPSADPRIIFYLALSDLITCIGLFTLGILLIMFDPPLQVGLLLRAKHVLSYEIIGGFVETFALFGFLASVLWTLSFAVDMCFQMYEIDCPMVVYHILSWCIPLYFVSVVQAVNFGYWPKSCEHRNGSVSRLIISYLPVVIVIMVNPILYLVTYKKVRQLLRSFGSFTVEDRQALNVCKWKLFWIKAAFTICWFPTIISVGYDLTLLLAKHDNPTQMSKLDYLWFLEAFLNPLQGVFNYFVYRRSFKVSPEDIGEGGLPRVPDNWNGTVDRCVGKEAKQTFKHASSSGLNEPSNILLRSGKTERSPKNPINEYRARLLGE